MADLNGIGGSTTQGAGFFKKTDWEKNQAATHVAYAGIPDIGSLLNGSQSQTQSTASGIRA